MFTTYATTTFENGISVLNKQQSLHGHITSPIESKSGGLSIVDWYNGSTRRSSAEELCTLTTDSGGNNNKMTVEKLMGHRGQMNGSVGPTPLHPKIRVNVVQACIRVLSPDVIICG